METQGPLPSPFDLDDPVASAAAQVEWLEIIRMVSGSVSGESPELWLGQLILEVQAASDRAVANAQGRADSLIAEARAEAIAIRDAGRRRARDLDRLRSLTHPELLVGRDPELLPRPPQPQAAPGSPPQPMDVAAPTAVGPVRALGATPGPVEGNSSDAPARPAPDEPTAPNPVCPKPGDGAGAPLQGHQPEPPAPTAQAAARALAPEPSSARSNASPMVSGGKSWYARHIRPKALLAVVAILAAALGLSAFERFGTAAREQGSQRHLAAELATAEAKTQSASRPASGAAFGFLNVPRLDIAGQGIVEGATLANLRRGPARDSHSQMPGGVGAVIIVGHRRTYGSPFRRLGELRVGDVISLRTPRGIYVYRVRRNPQVLTGSRSALELPGSDANGPVQQSLLLATSAYSRGTSIEVVVATLDRTSIGGLAAAPSSQRASAELQSIPGDQIGLLFALWWLLVLVCTIVMGRRLAPRFPRPWVFAGTAVVVLMFLYQVYLALDRLVPGLY